MWKPLVVCSTLLFWFPGVSYWYTCVLLIYSHLLPPPHTALVPLHMQYLMQCLVLTALLSSRLWLPLLWHCSQYSSFLSLLYSLPSCFTHVSHCVNDYCIDSARVLCTCTHACNVQGTHALVQAEQHNSKPGPVSLIDSVCAHGMLTSCTQKCALGAPQS